MSACTWLVFSLFVWTVVPYQPTTEELRELYGEKGANDAALYSYLNFWTKTQATTLRDAAMGRIFMGAISNSADLNNGDQQYKQVLSAQYSLQTAENECKWAATEPNQGVYSWGACDAASDFAQVNSSAAAFRGHNLCWGADNPSWLVNGGFSASQLEGFLQDHITQCIHRYSGQPKTRAYCWDVVNEAISDDSDPNTIYKNAPPWYPAISNYVDLAFQDARSADATMRLFYNDYGGEGYGTKSTKIYNMVSSMKQRGIPINGVGLQMHVSCDYYPSPSDVQGNMQRLNDLGLEVQITEMDVSCPDQDFSKQATIYASMLAACLQVKSCTSFQSWGFTDRYTWLGSSDYPLPFDYNYNPKAAVTSMLNTFPNYIGITTQLWGCQSSTSSNYKNQIWTWPPGPEVSLKYNLNWCLDVKASGTADGTTVWAYPCTNGANEQWSYNSTSQELVSSASGKCLTVNGGGQSWGTLIQISTCNAQASQKWTLPGDGTIRNGDLCLDAGSWSF